jgi:YkoY family integral membrane protein
LSWHDIIFPIITLIVMEGLLSVDNALVLSMMANKLKDPKQRAKAMYYGMMGAVVFRAIFILLGVWLVKLWFIKVIGALYLFKIAIDHFRSQASEGGDEAETVGKFQQTFMHRLLGKFGIKLTPFVSVIISIEMMDLAFSADSILAALAISNSFWVLLTGGILGIAMMRGVAGIFIKLINKVPEMEHTAFILIFIIATKMGMGTIHNFAALFGFQMHEIHISHVWFFAIIAGTFAATFVVHALRKKKNPTISA